MIRNIPTKAEDILSQFDEASRSALEDITKNRDSAINSHLLVRMLEAAKQIQYSSLTHLPLEIVLLELAEKNK